jgi:DNA polymerase-1
VRSVDGRRLRYAFVPTEGWLLAVSDYNQIELRILAHLSQDQGLLAAFASDEDVHRTIAASVFGVAPADVTHEQREQAKAVSYGLAYGMEAYGLSQRGWCPGGDRQGDHEPLLRGVPHLRAYMDNVIKEARAQGLLAHRVRAHPALSRPRDRRRSSASGRRASGDERRHPGPGGRHL